MGGKGERIVQCSKVRIVTAKPIPMQVDGEPVSFAPIVVVFEDGIFSVFWLPRLSTSAFTAR